MLMTSELLKKWNCKANSRIKLLIKGTFKLHEIKFILPYFYIMTFMKCKNVWKTSPFMLYIKDEPLEQLISKRDKMVDPFVRELVKKTGMLLSSQKF